MDNRSIISPEGADGGNNDDASRQESTAIRKRRRSVGVRILQATLLTLAVAVAVVLVGLSVAVAYLKPERLTPLVERVANEYLVDADLTVGRIELTFWSTFPRFELDVRDLAVRSRALDSLPADVAERVPACADSLLSVSRFNGALNVSEFLAGRISLYDITVDNPTVNFVQATAERSNLDIFPLTDEAVEDEEADDGVVIPDFSFGRFEITGSMPVRYVSLPDSTDLSLRLTTTSLSGNRAPDYALDVEGHTSVSFPAFTLRHVEFGLGGDIRWDSKRPMAVSVSDFRIGVGRVKASLSVDVDCSDSLRVNSFDFKMPETPVAELLALVPEEFAGELDKVKADFDVKLGMCLTEPFVPAVDSIPSVRIELSAPEGRLSYDRLILKRFALDVVADVSGKDLDKSTIDVKRLLAVGPGVGFALDCVVKKPMSDPAVSGLFKGGMEIERLPRALLRQLPFEINGSLRADSRFKFRMSDLDKNRFHRIRLTGNATLSNFALAMQDQSADFYADKAVLKLGTNSSFTRGQTSVDSLLTASLKIDSLAASASGMQLMATDLKIGIGCLNTASSIDSTLINPIGGRIVAERLSLSSTEDSMRIRLRKPTIGATLRRFEGNATKPQLHLDVATERAFYRDRVNRALLSKALLFVTAHPELRKRANFGSRLVDSLTRIYPDLPPDSIQTMVAELRKQCRLHAATLDSMAVAEGKVIDMSVDSSMSKLLREWDAKGVLKAERLRVFTPYFPLRNDLSGFNMRFSTDSVIISDTRLRVGHTSVVVDGNISNINRALTSKGRRQPLRMDFTLTGDTIEVNELADATFAGAAFAERDSAAMFVASDAIDDEQALQASIEDATATDSMTTLVVPSNIEADIEVNTNNIVYSNLTFSDFKGKLNIYNGAINLSNLSAKTTVGKIDLNALYSAPTREDASFAFGMRVLDFRVRQFLDLIPAVDSLMPMLSGIDGIIDADMAATADIDDGMLLNIPSFKAAMKLSGDSLVLIDSDTYKSVGKWLMFKDKSKNVIDSMSVELLVDDSRLELFPFIFDIDRYKLGVMGNNDLAMNLNYHVAVLKSPLPFKFGINISGNVDDMKIRVGKAKFNERNFPKSIAIADTTRINLVREIGNVFRRGVRNSKVESLDFNKNKRPDFSDISSDSSTISHSDSAYFIQHGLIAKPDSVPAIEPKNSSKKKKSKK